MTYKHRVAVEFIVNQLKKRLFGTWPKRTLAQFAAFAHDGDQGVAPVILAELKVADAQSDSLRHTSACVVEKQQQCVLDSASEFSGIGHLQDRLDLIFGQPRNLSRSGLFIDNGTQAAGPLDTGGIAAAYVASKHPYGAQALVASLRGAAAARFRCD